MGRLLGYPSTTDYLLQAHKIPQAVYRNILQISYEEGYDLVLKSLAPMGAEYCAFVHTTMTQRSVDRSDNIGKSSGAFCASPYGLHPYILITWSDTMRNVFTLAHELGHGGHWPRRHSRD